MNTQTVTREHPDSAPSSTRKKWEPPRGIMLLDRTDRPNRPHGVRWWVEGKRKHKWFPTLEKRETFARSLAGGVKAVGVAAFSLNEDEAKKWRAFDAQLDGASLDDVLACWRRHGKPSVAMTVREAVASYTAAKTSEGVSAPALAHYRPIFNRFDAAFGARDVRSVEREEIGAWIAGLEMAEHTLRSHHKRVQSLFSWLRDNRLIHESPCDGLKPVKITPTEVQLLTVDEAGSLFAKNKSEPRELCGRLALEAFAGLRFDTARQIVAAEIEFKQLGLTLPAAKMKTRRPQFIDGLPENLWAWLKWSKPEAWAMTARQYQNAKAQAFIRANISHPHNALRHSFATYHVAAFKDVGRTATILCHSSPKMLFAHYRGRATEADGNKYFTIRPPNDSRK